MIGTTSCGVIGNMYVTVREPTAPACPLHTSFVREPTAPACPLRTSFVREPTAPSCPLRMYFFYAE